MLRMAKRYAVLIVLIWSVLGCLLIWLRGDESTPEASRRHLNQITELLNQRPALTSKCSRQLHIWTDQPIYMYTSDPYSYRCPGVPCDCRIVASTDIATTEMSDALLLFPKTDWNWDKLHAARQTGQKWIFYSRESPARTKRDIIPPKKYYNTSYDYIMSFRRGSDFSAEYGTYDTSKPAVPKDDHRNWAENKTGLAIWVASNCQDTAWKRTKFVKQLASLIPINTYGECGVNGSCPHGEECEAQLVSHKFYLALENSECRDYITEKFFLNLQRGTVPIVKGAPRKDYERVGPPNSFIHVDDFSSVQALADYIKLVDADDELYNRYFEWKKQGSIVDVWVRFSLFKPDVMCKIFQRLHRDEMKIGTGVSTRRPMPDWEKWWLGSCLSIMRS